MRTNRFTDPRASTLSSFYSVNWGVGAGSFALGAVSGYPTPSGWVGTFSAASAGWDAQSATFPASPGEVLTFSIYGEHSWAAGQTRITAQFFDVGGANLGYFAGPIFTLGAATPTRISYTVTSPASAASVAMFWDYQGGATAPVGGVFKIAAPMIEASPVLLPYFDGTTASTPQTLYTWTGTANASTSTASDWVTVVQTSDPGAPQVGITVANLSTTAEVTATVETSWDGGATWNAVRGGIISGALGSTFLRDYVPAIGVPVLYRATLTGGTTFVGLSAPVTVTSAQAWIQDPLAPKSAVPLYADMAPGHILLTLGSLATSTWAQHVDVAVPIGSNLAAASLSVRQKVSALPLVLTYDVAAEGGALRNLLMSAGQLVVRGLPSTAQLDPVAHVVVGDASEARLAANTVAQWTLTARQVRPVTMRVVIPWWTYDQVKALVQSQVGVSATFDQVKTAMPLGKTFTDWVANPGVV